MERFCCRIKRHALGISSRSLTLCSKVINKLINLSNYLLLKFTMCGKIINLSLLVALLNLIVLFFCLQVVKFIS